MFNLFKLIHIVAAMVWIGGGLALLIINIRMNNPANRNGMESFAQQAAFYGRVILGPAAGITLIAGITAAILGHVRFNSVWIMWGFGGIAVSLVLGAIFIRRTTEELSQLAAKNPPDQTRLSALQSRLRNLNLINMLVLISVVTVMVFKPM